MQKVKQIFSNSDETDRSAARHSTGSEHNSGTLGSLGSGHSSHNNTTTGIHSEGREGYNSSTGMQGNPSGLTSGTRDSSTGVGEKGLGRDPVAGGTGHNTMTDRVASAGDRHSDNHSGSHVGNTGAGITGSNIGSLGGSHSTSATSGTTGATSGNTGEHRSITDKLTGKHTFGHDNRTDNKFDPTGENTTHDHKHLQGVTHETHRHQEVEEVERQREHHRHVHHLQHHVQPVHDTHVKDEVHHHNAVPVTHINEKHANTEEDVKLFRSLGEKHRDEERHLPKERTVVDLGEKVNEITHHHVHHVTQPVVEREVHDKHRIHTVIPLSHTVHEAPIIHKSSVHEPVHMSDFLKGGGKLDSGLKHGEANILSTGECDRTVDGVGEKLAQELNLKPSTFGHSGTSSTTSGLTHGSTGQSGLTHGSTGQSGLTHGSTGQSGLTHGSTGQTGLTSGQNVGSNKTFS